MLASEILSSVGGLRVGTSGPGIDCATSDIFFSDHFAYERQELLGSLFLGLGSVASLGDAHNT
jgi:hypothetical protein